MRGQWVRGQGNKKEERKRELGGRERRRQCDRRERMETGGDKRQREGTEREVGGRESRRRREWRLGDKRQWGKLGGHGYVCVWCVYVGVGGGGGAVLSAVVFACCRLQEPYQREIIRQDNATGRVSCKQYRTTHCVLF